MIDNKALFSLSYGVFLLSSKDGEKINACITNTCMQVASEPVRLAISCINTNLTCEMIKNSGLFTLSVLDEDCRYDAIKHFGMQSGRDVDKFANLKPKLDSLGLPYLSFFTTAVLSCKVIELNDLGTHTMFIGELKESFTVSGKSPLTYADYHSKVKPKPQIKNDKKIIGWRCKICNYVYESSDLPLDFICPLCGHDASDFEPIYK